MTNFSKSIAWGIFKEIISIIRNNKEDGSFILMKTFGETSAKSLLKLFKVPDSYFKSEDSDNKDPEPAPQSNNNNYHNQYRKKKHH